LPWVTESLESVLSAHFSPSKIAILKLLKVKGETTLSDLAKITGISKMGVLKHLTKLEQEGLIERESIYSREIGRPEHAFKLTSGANELFPKAYTDIAMCALAFIEQHEGRAGIKKMLQARQKELFERYTKVMDPQSFSLKERVSKLTELRDSDGYMATSRPLRKSSSSSSSSYVISEHNCPILALASKYGEACSTEVELFKWILKADVEASHRAALGDPICRFVVRPPINEK
jgi:predicted ArsR family transcriptional regulator